MGGLVGGGGAGVPDEELLVVTDGSEEGVVEEMPGDVLDDGGVALEDGLGLEGGLVGGG